MVFAGEGNRVFLLALLTVTCLIAALLLPAMAQPLSYHAFADCRSWWSLPNTLNVLSNLPFLVFGLLGLEFLLRRRPQWHEPDEALPYLVFFLGAALTCVGSMYYHWQPDNPRLVWDRLPMTLAFSGLIAAVLGERIAPHWGRRALWPLLVAGAGSVLFWYATERIGRGNVIPYGMFQFWAILVVLLLLLLFPARRYSHGQTLFWPILWYGLAKVAETFDLGIYRATGALVSGHTVKHLLAAMAVWALLRMLQARSRLPLADAQSVPAA